MRVSSQDFFFFFSPSQPLCMPEISFLYVLLSSHHSCKKLNCIVFVFSCLMFLCNGRRGSWIIYVLLGSGIFVCLYFWGFSSHCIYRKVAAHIHYTVHIMSAKCKLTCPRAHWYRSLLDSDREILIQSNLAEALLQQCPGSSTATLCSTVICRLDLACRMSLQLHLFWQHILQTCFFKGELLTKAPPMQEMEWERESTPAETLRIFVKPDWEMGKQAAQLCLET